MKILLITDTWAPNINGVVRVLAHTVEECRELGHDLRVISPHDGFLSLSMGKLAESPHPNHPPNRLVLGGKRRMEQLILDFAPNAAHIATEGPLGWAGRHLCRKYSMPYTSAYHTRFPEYFKKWTGLPTSIPYSYLRRFHQHSDKILVPSASIGNILTQQGFGRICTWPHGVNTQTFHPRFRDEKNGPASRMKRPLYLYVGRIAAEKNVRAFLELELPGSKLLVGDGPARQGLERDFPECRFVGTKLGEELARHYACSDVFVLPSKTETFGLVMLEALASGVPVAAFDAPGPRDVLAGTRAGHINENLQTACLDCLKLDGQNARKLAETYSWRACAEQFLNFLSVKEQFQHCHAKS